MTGITRGGAREGGRAAGSDFDVLIAGAGVIGTTMASLLVAHKLVEPGRVAVVADRLPPPAVVSDENAEWGSRVFALSRASQQLLKACGAWAALPPQLICAYERMRVWVARSEPRGDTLRTGSLTFDCAEFGEPNLGLIVDGRALQTHCLRAASAAGVVFMEAGIEDIVIDDAGVRIRLHDGRDLSSQLLIAADGSESTTRELLRLETAGHAYLQDALVAHVRTAKSHGRTAWQRFLPTGPLAFLPLPDGRSSIVWSVMRAEATRLRSMDATAFADALTTASGGVLGRCELTTAVVSFPLKLQYALDYVRPRAVLLGDAAHAVHPLAGQGLNLGLLDCASLAQVLSECGSAGFFGEHKLLRRYERWRRSENLLTATALDGLERLFSSDNALLSRLRIAGLDAVDRVPFIKRQLAERALGLGGDVPAFLKAEAGARIDAV
jgi:2-polyprenylphenol 6-hydroxylase